MSLSRYYLPRERWTGPAVSLTEEEVHHCARVRRQEVGDKVEVFDGQGQVAVAQIENVGKASVGLRMDEIRQVVRSHGGICLMPALIKTEPFEWLLEKAVELGATSIQPVITERTVVHLNGEQWEKKAAKWRRHMIESAKQCHTPFLPELHAPLPFAKAVQQSPANAHKLIPALVEDTKSIQEVLEGGEAKDSAMVLIGPEGDFTSAELLLARQEGFQAVTLGPYILRAETAAIAVLAILNDRMRIH